MGIAMRVNTAATPLERGAISLDISATLVSNVDICPAYPNGGKSAYQDYRLPVREVGRYERHGTEPLANRRCGSIRKIQTHDMLEY